MIDSTASKSIRPADAYDFTGQSVIVTGAGGGIGRATARLFGASGAAVICADIAATADETARMIDMAGGRAVAYRCDVSRRDDVDVMVASAQTAFGRLDVLVNDAAIISNATVAQLEEPELDRIIAVNLKGVFFCCKSAARVMVAQRSGAIINLASCAIDTGIPNTVAYSMCKAAVVQLTKCLAAEVAGFGVRVNTISPGFVVTPMTSRHFTQPDGLVDESKKAEVVARLSHGQLLDRVGEPLDIAFPILFLASAAARFVTGQNVRPNGGISLPT